MLDLFVLLSIAQKCKKNEVASEGQKIGKVDAGGARLRNIIPGAIPGGGGKPPPWGSEVWKLGFEERRKRGKEEGSTRSTGGSADYRLKC